MLQRAGLTADVQLAQGSIEVRVGEHRASFPATNATQAANWLAACTVMNYPESDLAKLWLMLATVAGGVIPFGS